MSEGRGAQPQVVPLKEVVGRHVQAPWAFERDEQVRINAFWANFHARNPHSFNGRIFLQHRWQLEAGIYTADYLEADYASFLAWRDFGFPGAPMRNGFAMAALRSADGAYLLGEMAPGTANAGMIYFAAGTPDGEDRRADGTLDLAGSVLRELCEETGLRAEEVRVGAGWTGVIEHPRAAFMREVSIDLPAREARALMLARMQYLPEQELADIHIVRGPGDIDPDRMPGFQVAFLQWAFDNPSLPSPA